MNLMIVINSMSGGGAERVTAWLSGRWASAGRVVTVVTLADEADHAYRLEPGVRLVQLGVATESKTIWGSRAGKSQTAPCIAHDHSA